MSYIRRLTMDILRILGLLDESKERRRVNDEERLLRHEAQGIQCQLELKYKHNERLKAAERKRANDRILKGIKRRKK